VTTASIHLAFEVEVRLWTAYAGQVLIIPGIIGVGQALENHAHWAILAVAWGLYVAGGLIVSSIIFLIQIFPSCSSPERIDCHGHYSLLPPIVS